MTKLKQTFRALRLSKFMLALSLALAVGGVVAGTASANPDGTGGAWWQYWNIDLYVGSLQVGDDGALAVQFLDGSNRVYKGWVHNTSSVCTNLEWLSVSGRHPQLEAYRQVLQTAAIARTPLRIAIEPGTGTCYVKFIRAVHRAGV